MKKYSFPALILILLLICFIRTAAAEADAVSPEPDPSEASVLPADTVRADLWSIEKTCFAGALCAFAAATIAVAVRLVRVLRLKKHASAPSDKRTADAAEHDKTALEEARRQSRDEYLKRMRKAARRKTASTIMIISAVLGIAALTVLALRYGNLLAGRILIGAGAFLVTLLAIAAAAVLFIMLHDSKFLLIVFFALLPVIALVILIQKGILPLGSLGGILWIAVLGWAIYKEIRNPSSDWDSSWGSDSGSSSSSASSDSFGGAQGGGGSSSGGGAGR